jgi:hypothetical protein
MTCNAQVNARLAKVEQEHGGSTTGDPHTPKLQWPTAAACPKCRRAAAAGDAAGDAGDGAGDKPAVAAGPQTAATSGEEAAAAAAAAAASSTTEGGDGSASEGAGGWDEVAVFAHLEAVYKAAAPDPGASAPGGAGRGVAWDMVVWLVVGTAALALAAFVILGGSRPDHGPSKKL